MDPILLIALVLGLAILVLLIILLLRKPADTSALRDEMRALRGMNEKAQSLSRQEILSQFKNLNQISLAAISQISSNTGRDLEAMRAAMDRRLAEIQAENEKSLAELRQTVNKNLSETLTDSLAASFQSVSSQLEQVYKSMGEMRSMTADVTDLKRILGNVKNRGTWGEVQLESLLSDILSSSQYAAQLSLSGSAEKVDFAVRLPGDGEKPVYLPIDSKFPMDRYRAVLDAEQYGDDRAKALSRETLLKTVRDEAKKIAAKYILPPDTTDFAVLFVPSEGLYAYLAAADLPFALQRDFRILLAGPSNLSALLNSFQLGFRTLAVERQSGEILKLLGAVKTSFAAFSARLESTQKSLRAAENNLERAFAASRGIERRLQGMEKADLFTARELLGEDSFPESGES